MPVLTRTAKKSSDGMSRVVSTGSFVQWMGRSNEMNFQQLERGGPKGINSWDVCTTLPLFSYKLFKLLKNLLSFSSIAAPNCESRNIFHRGSSSEAFHLRGNSLWTNAMARRHTAKGGVVFLTVNPGLIAVRTCLIRLKNATYPL